MNFSPDSSGAIEFDTTRVVKFYNFTPPTPTTPVVFNQYASTTFTNLSTTKLQFSTVFSQDSSTLMWIAGKDVKISKTATGLPNIDTTRTLTASTQIFKEMRLVNPAKNIVAIYSNNEIILYQ